MVEDPDRAERFVTIILNHSERLATLIGDLLTLSEMESGEFSLQLHPVPLAATIRHAAGLVELKAGEKGIVLDISVPDDTPAVLADQGRLEQVFINLLDNAVKYTPGSGRVTVAVTDGEGAVIVRVSDTGAGIPPQSLPRIFERFYRVDTARSRDQGGTGLGLAIVKHIVQLHGGTISVESTPGKGSSFVLTLRKA
ncbi:MAG: GHKL domain-containing protein [Geobacter sp.]|nr:GHKL domain-containing protein [Geobacter sp.]